MAKKKTSHTMKILIKFLNGETVISSDVFASNTNQYFGHIKDEGIKLIEWNDPKDGKHLKRKLETSEENIKKAREYLKKLGGSKNVA